MRFHHLFMLDEHGQPVGVEDVLVWARWFESHDRHVAETWINGAIRVSTVYVGVDHSYGLGGPPILWETMIFGGPHDGYQNRYASADAARAGHELAVLIAEGKA